MSGKGVVLFNASKGEAFRPGKRLKHWTRRLKQQSFEVRENRDDELRSQLLSDVRVLVFGAPREKFNQGEIECIKDFVEGGGSVMVMMNEGGEEKLNTNINFLLEQYGIFVNPDSVVRCTYDKYLHPKEALIPDGVVNRAIGEEAIKNASNQSDGSTALLRGSDTAERSGVEFVFPYSATLQVQKPAVPVLSTGSVCYPLNVPVGAINDKARGKLLVLGSARAFSDDYLNKEDNGALADALIKWLCGEIRLHTQDVLHPDVSELVHVPDTENLSTRLRCCLQEGDQLPRDFSKLFDLGLFKFDTSLVPEVLKLYEKMDVKHDVLSLIPPQFEAPLPPLQPAVFPPALREPPPPALDLFDLDEHFASERVRLAHLTNRYEDNDLEYIVKEAGSILGITANLAPEKQGAKDVLEYMCNRIMNWKRLNPHPL